MTTLEAATTPRRQLVGRGRAPRPGLGLGRDHGDLAQQVHDLLHVADEVATGELVVLVEHVGERVAARPPVHRVGEPGIGGAGLGQSGVLLVTCSSRDRRSRADASARPARRPHRGGADRSASGPRRSNVKHDTSAASLGRVESSRTPVRRASATRRSASV